MNPLLPLAIGAGTLVLAVIIDLLVGDPSPWKPWHKIYNLHPTVWLGNLTKALEPHFKTGNDKVEKLGGVFLALIVIAAITVPTYFGIRYLYIFSSALFGVVFSIIAVVIVAGIIFKFTICIKLETDGA